PTGPLPSWCGRASAGAVAPGTVAAAVCAGVPGAWSVPVPDVDALPRAVAAAARCRVEDARPWAPEPARLASARAPAEARRPFGPSAVPAGGSSVAAASASAKPLAVPDGSTSRSSGLRDAAGVPIELAPGGRAAAGGEGIHPAVGTVIA